MCAPSGAINGVTVVNCVVGIVHVRQPYGHDGLCGFDCADARAARRGFGRACEWSMVGDLRCRRERSGFFAFVVF